MTGEWNKLQLIQDEIEVESNKNEGVSNDIRFYTRVIYFMLFTIAMNTYANHEGGWNHLIKHAMTYIAV